MLFNKKFLAVASMLLVLGGCKEKSNQNQQAMQPPTVSVIEVEPENVPLSFEFAARAQGSKETQF